VRDSPEALRHTHHFIIHSCTAPQGSTDEETFERFIGRAGGECYKGSPDVPIEHCGNSMFIWAAGGKTVVYPDHVGYPLAVDGKTTYQMLEVHIDNPNNLRGVKFETGVEILYTPRIRQHNVGLMSVGQITTFALTVPPRSEGYVIAGHCSPSCSSRLFPETGLNVFQILLHSHLAGRKIRLRHYRNGIELPWISSDDHYDFNFQQNRLLLEEIKLLPGDHLTTECTYSSMDANGTVIGGQSTTEEMCNSNLAYYPAIDFNSCRSVLVMTDLLTEFGMEHLDGSTYNPVISSPERMSNKTYKEVLDTMIPWTDEFRSHVQNLMRYGDNAVVCGRDPPNYSDIVKYYDTSKEYVPLDECANRENSDASGSDNQQSTIRSSLYLMACTLAMVTTKVWI